MTLNAFPYSQFHDGGQKRRVYYPDWSQEDRFHYTVNCAQVLAALLPEDAAQGSISTLPLGWRSPWSPERDTAARRRLSGLPGRLRDLAGRTGRRIPIGLEPEPGALVETTEQAAALLGTLDPEWLGICLDLCHLAVAHESPPEAVERLERRGIPIVKTQISCGLHVNDPRDPVQRGRLQDFDEPRFLHQTRERVGGRVHGTDDLPEALGGGLPGRGPWRVHFHVPVNEPAIGGLPTTREELRKSLGVLFGGPRALTDHAEVETYTWPVLLDRGTGPGDPGGGDHPGHDRGAGLDA